MGGGGSGGPGGKEQGLFPRKRHHGAEPYLRKLPTKVQSGSLRSFNSLEGRSLIFQKSQGAGPHLSERQRGAGTHLLGRLTRVKSALPGNLSGGSLTSLEA